MKSFNYKNPTEIIFGNGRIKEIGSLLEGKAKKVLLTTGKGSVKKNGIFDTVVKSLKEHGIEYVEYSGIKPNPTLKHAQAGAALAREEKVDGILALGGGSVVDESKAIAIGACYKGDLWDFYCHKAVPKKSIPLYVILTVPATGSEMNPNGVITNEETKDKWGFRTPLNYPVFSILDPETTLSIPIEYTIAAAIDIMTHSMEAYFSKTDNDSFILDRFVEALVKSDLEALERLVKNPKDLEARANIMWTATLAWNGLVNCGAGPHVIVNHVIEHPLSAVYDITHANGLAILIPASMTYYKEKYQKRLAMFGKNVFGLTGDEEKSLADKTIIQFKVLFSRLGVPVTLSEAGITNPDIEFLASQTMKLLGNTDLITKKDVEEILKLAL